MCNRMAVLRIYLMSPFAYFSIYGVTILQFLNTNETVMCDIFAYSSVSLSIMNSA